MFSKLTQWSDYQNTNWNSETTTMHVWPHIIYLTVKHWLQNISCHKQSQRSLSGLYALFGTWTCQCGCTEQPLPVRTRDPVMKIWSFCPHSHQILPGFFAARPLNHFHCLSSISPRPFHLLYMFNPAKRSLWQMAAASWKWLTSTCPSVWCSQRSSVLLPAYTKYAKFRTFAISTLI